MCICFGFLNVKVQIDLPFRDSIQKVKLALWLCFVLGRSSTARVCAFQMK